jgi:uncharacterized integral membrane protein
MSYKLILTLILVGISVIFVIQNVAVVEITFLLWSFAMSRSLLFFILLSTGLISGWFLNSYHRRRKK